MDESDLLEAEVELLDDVVNLADDDIEEITLPSLTYEVINGRIIGKIDGSLAMRQAIEKILLTDRFVWEIYSNQYGNDLSELIGKELPYVKAELGRMIDEALKGDDRVDDVAINDIQQTERDTLLANVTVSTMYGNITVNSEVIV